MPPVRLREAFANTVGKDRPGGRQQTLSEFRDFIYGRRVAKLLAEPGYDDPVSEPSPDVDDHHAGEYHHADGQAEGDDADADGATTWEPVDLGPWLRGEVERPEPTMGIARSDGLRLIYPGREHVVIGETESGKSWVALACAATELNAGNHVIYVHFEEADPGSTIERLRLLGVADTMIGSRLRFTGPTRPVRVEWLKPLLDPVPSLVVFDGVNEGMSLHGDDIKDADGASAFRRRLIRPCVDAGAATLSCDHVPMIRDPSRKDAYGSVHKGNALDGARILLENVEPFGRACRGVSYLFITKDRPGHLRAHGRPTKMPGKTFMGTFVVDDMTLGPDFYVRFFAPKDGDKAADNPADDLADTVYDVIAALPGRTVDSMRLLFAEMRKAGHEFRDDKIRGAAADLIVSGRLIDVSGKRGAKGLEAVVTASRESPNTTSSATASRDCVPLREGRGTQSTGDRVGRSGMQWDAVEEEDTSDTEGAA
jgi:hypothetical protein